jgi:hypothetical protein
MEALAEAAPERLEAILNDPSYELPLAIASHQKVLGEVLIALEDQDPKTIEQIGWLMIALTEVAICWWNHT